MNIRDNFINLKKLVQMDIRGILTTDGYFKALQIVYDISKTKKIVSLEIIYSNYLQTGINSKLAKVILDEILKHNSDFFKERVAVKKMTNDSNELVKQLSQAHTDEERQQLKDNFCKKYGIVAFEIATNFID